MCRLAVLFRRPLHEVVTWPASDVRLLQHYLSRQPSHEQRIEILLARLIALFLNRGKADGQQLTNVGEVLMFQNPFDDETEAEDGGRYSALDLEIMRFF